MPMFRKSHRIIKLHSDKVSFVESDHKGGISMVYLLQRVGPELTRIELHMLMKPHWLKSTVVDLFLKKKLHRINEKSVANLGAYCKKLADQTKVHPQQIVLPKEVI